MADPNLLSPSPEGEKKKKKKKKDRHDDGETAFVLGASPAPSSSRKKSSLQSASADSTTARNPLLDSLGSSTDEVGLSIGGGNRFLAAGIGAGGGGGGYGATLSSDSYYSGMGVGGGDDDDGETSALLRPANAELGGGGGNSPGVATSTASPLSPNGQEILARFMAAQGGGVGAAGSSTPERRKNVVGGLAGDKDDGKKSGICGFNVVAGVVLVVVLATVAALGAVFYSRLSVEKDDDSGDVTPWVRTNKPHVVFFLADDLGWNSIGYEDYDLSFATPFLTGLAKQGIIMNNYYAQEVCTPARAALLTGRYPLTTGMQYSMIMPTTAWGLHLNETLLSSVLKDNGYKTRALGKWHLGHYNPRYLPTARGFDSFTGYLSGENYYWSKKNPDHSNFVDMLTSDSSCYAPYMEDDLHDYSTFLYRDKAIAHIEEHDESEALFLYVAFQAVHDPYNDFNHHSKGLPKEYLSDGVYEQIGENVIGHKRRQYAMALSVMDDAVSDVYDALDARGFLDNTYIIFSSDNGGCYLSGGKNGPLRGSKGSLFEGGLKVDGFIYSASTAFIPEGSRGQLYNNLMHVSDWFPTILDLAGISYTPDEDSALDGVSHVDAWLGRDGATIPRDYMLYNYYYDVTDYAFNKWTNGSFAIRNAQYKLMHTYDSTAYGAWWDGSDKLDNDDTLAESTCSQALASTGEFTYYLFDLVADPYETTNLYHEDGSDYHAAKVELYAALDEMEARARGITVDAEERNKVTPVIWKKHGDYIVPWVLRADLGDFAGSFPEDCYTAPTHAPTKMPSWSAQPTTAPTFEPTHSPTVSPTAPPTPSAELPPSTEPTEPVPTPVPTTAKPTNAPTGGAVDNTPTWFFTPTVGVPTIGVPTIGVPTIQQPSLINEPTCEGCPTTLPILLDGPTWSPTASTGTTPTTVTIPTASTPTW